ncbi:hypothetical protein Pan216_08600 [Planctomycetes bacterium Pan216]|uniref:HTH cro/C1-type domain-containing protein n=1 Tax=Kolteria novifilia TaxID=2527975 RepID=A0A518AZ65_9BACT|nr:hypothetical protein Pan216_08600 [Planctomycetes bacterium Pan216]
MAHEHDPPSPSEIPGVTLGSQWADEQARRPSPAQQKQARRDTFRRNFLAAMENSGLTIDALSEQSGVDMPTLRRWETKGVIQPKHSHLRSVARVFGLADPWMLLDPDAEISPENAPSSRNSPTRSLHPTIEEVRDDRPELFDAFTTEEWSELTSHRGVGGALSYEGVIHQAERINRKREIRRKFETLLESEHFRTLADMIDLMHRDVQLPRPK